MPRSTKLLSLTFATGGIEFLQPKARTPTTLHFPDELDLADTSAIGAWLRAELDARSVSTRSAAVYLQRREIATRRLHFDSVPDVLHDLPGMVRLQAEDQAAGARDTVVDYTTPADTPEKGPATGLPAMTAALPSTRLSAIKEIASAAGLKLRSIGALGLAVHDALADELAPNALLLAETEGGAEVIVTDGDGFPRLSRWLGYSDPANDHEAAANELRRILLMQQGGAATLPDHGLVVASDPGDAEELASALSKRLSFAFEPSADSTLALATHETRSPDFLDPTGAPDRAATTRQLVMAAALALLVLGGAGYTLANMAVERERANLETLRAELQASEKTRVERVRAAALAEHRSRWLDVALDPASELARLLGPLPPQQELFLTELTLVTDSEIAYERQRRENSYRSDRWVSRSRLRADVRGAGASSSLVHEAWESLLAQSNLSVEPLVADGATTNIERYPGRFELRLVGKPLPVSLPTDDEPSSTALAQEPTADTEAGATP